MQKWLYRFFIELTNHRFISYLLRKFAQSRVSAILIPSYAKIYKIDQEEIEKNIKDFRSLHELFIRQLKKESRTINEEETSIISPVDAVVEEMGSITADKEIIVKDKRYSISEMLGDDKYLQKYINGDFVILYLSPSHYHRIHCPISGTVTKQWELGLKSYPVNKLGLKYGKSPLSKNYRKITEIKAEHIHIALVKVGAMFVNSIELTHPSEKVTKGEELAYFSFGSTVVLLFEKGAVQLSPDIYSSKDVKVGDVIAYVNR